MSSCVNDMTEYTFLVSVTFTSHKLNIEQAAKVSRFDRDIPKLSSSHSHAILKSSSSHPQVILKSNLVQPGPVWSNLIQSDPILRVLLASFNYLLSSFPGFIARL